MHTDGKSALCPQYERKSLTAWWPKPTNSHSPTASKGKAPPSCSTANFKQEIKKVTKETPQTTQYLATETVHEVQNSVFRRATQSIYYTLKMTQVIMMTHNKNYFLPHQSAAQHPSGSDWLWTITTNTNRFAKLLVEPIFLFWLLTICCENKFYNICQV